MSQPTTGKQLNRIDDESIEWFVGNSRRLIEKAAGDAGRLWKAHFTLATHRYQQNAPDAEVRNHFEQAAQHGVTAWADRDPPGDGTSRTPWDFGVMLGVVAAFGDRELRGRAGAIERWKWFSPEDSFYLLLADSLSQVQSFLAGRFSPEHAARVVERCNAENADRDARRFDGPLVESLLAIHHGDVPQLETMLATMVKEHEHRAMNGELQHQTDGLVATLPLGLVRLAREADMECAIESRHVPVNLL